MAHKLTWFLLVLGMASVLAISPAGAQVGDPTGTVYVLEWSPDGATIASAGVGFLRVWDAETQDLLYDLPVGPTYVFGVSFSPDGKRLVSGSDDQYMRLWNIADDSHLPGELIAEFLPFPPPENIFPGYFSLFTTVDWSPDGTIIATGGAVGDSWGEVRLWDAESLELEDVIGLGWMDFFVWSPHVETREFVVAGQSGGPVIFSALARPQGQIFPIGNRNVPTQAMTWNSDGNAIAVGYVDGSITIWDRPNENPIVTIPPAREYPITQISWSPDDTRIAAADGFEVRVWNTEDGQLLETVPVYTRTVDFSPDGQTLAIGLPGRELAEEPAPLPPSDLTGTITLPNRTPGTSAYAVNLDVRLAQGGTTVSAHSPTTDVNGYFTLQDLPQGTVDAWLKHALSLAVMPSVNLDAPAVNVNFGTLKMGDADSSNLVNIADFSIVAAAYGSVEGGALWDERADFDGNDAVNYTDFSMLSANFSQSGAPEPTGYGGMMAALDTRPTGPVQVLLRGSSSRVRVGRTFEVTVRVRAGTQPVDGVSAYLTFDPALFQVEAITSGTTLPEVLQSVYDNAGGHVDFSAGVLGGSASGTFTLATVRFRAVAPTPGATIQLAAGDPLRVTDARSGGEAVYGGGEAVTVIVQ
ncbi:MAG: hypothetical protein IPK19_28770 [Chloroflexi bacterium]|nr:hypothetical protein [Chloroflexota bacterium]